MAYLVTGGTGYIGSYVVRDLVEAGKKVVCLQRSGVTATALAVMSEDQLKKVKIVQGDVGNTLLLFEVIREHGIDLIIHTGYSIPPASEEEPAYALRVNCIGMNNILEAARLFGLKRVVWTSSGRAFGGVGSVYKAPIGDEAIYMPDSMYGATKVLNDYMAKLYFDKFNVDSIGFRLPHVFGIGKFGRGEGGPIFQEMLRKAALNIPQTVVDGDRFKFSGLIHVEDVADIIVKACDAPSTRTRVFNLAEGNYTNLQIIEAIRKINPQAPLTISHEAASKKPSQASMDATAVRTELGWQPKYSLEEGLRKVMNYYRQKEGRSLL